MNHDWHDLIQRYIAGTLADDDALALQNALKSDKDLRALYLDYINLDVALEAHAGSREAVNEMLASPRTEPSRPLRWLSWRPLTAAAVVALLGIAWLWFHQTRVVAFDIVSVSSDAVPDWKKECRMRTNDLRMTRGTMQLRLSSGVTMDVTAPIEVKLIDAMHVRVLSGRVTADVGEHGKGFVIETPQTRIVDLGTRFGVDASDSAHTDVVVFEGQVELYEKGVAESVALLNKGEGLRVGSHRRASRIVSVTGSDELNAWSTQARPAESAVIAFVTDSMVTNDEGAKKWPSLRNFYRIVPGGLRDGALAFAEEIDQWRDVPPSLSGSDLVRTFAVDGFNWWMQMSVTVQRPCDVFVFVDMRNEVPVWLSQEFTNTGEKVTLDRISHKAPQRVANRFEFAIWKKTVTQPGEVKLGPPYPNPPADRKSFNPNRMFGVAAKALP